MQKRGLWKKPGEIVVRLASLEAAGNLVVRCVA